MQRHGLAEPVPKEVQELAVRSMEEDFLKITGKAGFWGIAAVLAYFIYKILQKFGIKASLFQAKIVLVAVTIPVAAGSGIGVYTVQKIVREKYFPPQIKKEIKDKTQTSLLDKKREKSITPHIASPLKYRIGIGDFEGSDPHDISHIVNILSGELRKLAGQKAIIKIGNRSTRGKADRILLGGIRKIENEYLVTIRLVDVESARTIYITSGRAKKKEELDLLCRKLSQKIFNTLQQNQ